MVDVEWVEKVIYTGYFETPPETPAPPADLLKVLGDVEPGAEGEGGTSVIVAVGESDSLGIAFMTKHRNWPMCILDGQFNRTLSLRDLSPTCSVPRIT